MAESREPAGAVLVSRAREAYGSDDVQVDDDAAAVAVDGGVWVQAWLWVPGVESRK